MSRRAFTLVEMLVVIAIIGTLIAILLPAVNLAREASRKAGCFGNLRQIGLAIHQYHIATNSFPPGSINDVPNRATGARSFCCDAESMTSWTIAILPYMEMTNVYNKYKQTHTNESPENAYVRELSMAIYTCPSDIHRKTLLLPETGIANSLELRYMSGSYRGVGGSSDGTGWWDNSRNIPNPPIMSKGMRGVFHAVYSGSMPIERFDFVKDGLSSTIMVGDSYVKSNPARHTLWAYSFGSYNKSDMIDDPRLFINDYEKCMEIVLPGTLDVCNHNWGGFHNGTTNFLFCDGAVKSMSTLLDRSIAIKLAAIADGKFFTMPQ